jgi:hypothetical protein
VNDPWFLLNDAQSCGLRETSLGALASRANTAPSIGVECRLGIEAPMLVKSHRFLYNKGKRYRYRLAYKALTP